MLRDCPWKLCYVRVDQTTPRLYCQSELLQERGMFRAFGEASRQDVDRKAPVAWGAVPSSGHPVCWNGQAEIGSTCPALWWARSGDTVVTPTHTQTPLSPPPPHPHPPTHPHSPYTPPPPPHTHTPTHPHTHSPYIPHPFLPFPTPPSSSFSSSHVVVQLVRTNARPSSGGNHRCGCETVNSAERSLGQRGERDRAAPIGTRARQLVWAPFRVFANPDAPQQFVSRLAMDFVLSVMSGEVSSKSKMVNVIERKRSRSVAMLVRTRGACYCKRLC